MSVSPTIRQMRTVVGGEIESGIVSQGSSNVSHILPKFDVPRILMLKILTGFNLSEPMSCAFHWTGI
jgi:hypothetical protein